MMYSSSSLPPEQIALRIDCWKRRLRSEDAATLCGCTAESLGRWYRQHGFVVTNERGIIRKNGITPKVGNEIIRLWNAGLNAMQIAEVAGYAPATVRGYLRKHTDFVPYRGACRNDLSPEQIALRIDCWKKRMSFDEAAAVCGIRKRTLVDWLAKHGFKNTADTGLRRRDSLSFRKERAHAVHDL